jgi:hypothetical protein
MEIACQLIGARIANVSAEVGALCGSEKLDRHQVTIGAVAQTIVCATMTQLPSLKALRVA